MTALIESVQLAAILLGSGSLLLIYLEMRRIRLDGLPFVRYPTTSVRVSGVMGSVAGYGIFISRAGQWVLDADLSKPGYEPTPPTIEPSYEGQVVKKESVRRRR